MLRGVVVLAALAAGACSVLGSSLDDFTKGGGSASCDLGLESCGSDCVDTNSDPKHCGACGNACDSAKVCANGACADSCPSGLENCSGACVDIQKDAQHCGACGSPCSAGQLCTSGTCDQSCGAGQTACGSSCVDTQTDEQHCGACDSPCAVGQACQGGTCVADCQTGQTQCGDVCVDTQANAQNCGGCGQACATGESCQAGKCEVTCPGGQVACSGLCFDLQNDVNNCGSCANKCAAGEVCGNGQCALVCPTGQTACSGQCADLQTDSAHCGTCGNACGVNEECSGGSCVIACKTQLNNPLPADPWGEVWDGNERAAADYATAESTCEGIGGRLPTATELYRVSATQSATVGQSIHTNWLWSIVPRDATSRVRVRLSDANVASQTITSSLNYRCVCPPPLPKSFVGNNCHGPSGQACYGLETEGKRYNIDLQDRAPLTVGSAIWECTFNRGHLPTFTTMFEAIQQGLDGGTTNNWLHTADSVHNNWTAIVRWQNTLAAPLVMGNGSWSGTTTNRPFRCIGVNYESGTHPATIPDEFVGPLSAYKGEAVDSAATATWAEANDACFAKGGHVPRDDELAELIQQGLDGGTTNSWLWTSDQVGYNGTDFLTKEVRWTGTAPEFSFTYSGDMNWTYKTANRLYRCIYYPVDTSYAGPAAADCAGGCTELALPGTSGAKMWLDSFDRAPPADFEVAVDTCRQNGGHLASNRDLIEAIRAGLPNGSNAWLWTSDMSKATNTNGNLLMQIVRWQGVDAAYSDQYNTYSTWSNPTTTRPFRCMWSNELR